MGHTLDVMRTAVLDAPRTVSLRMARRPAPASGEVRIRLEGSGVCGSNLAVWQGQPWFDYPLHGGAPGHEGWGVVDAVGEGVDTPSPGTRVACLSSRAFAEYDVTPAAWTVELPAALDGQAFPGEALGCAFNIVRRAAMSPGLTVAVVGVGFLGAVLTRLAATAGARVIAVSRRPYALEVARAHGASETVPLDAAAPAIARVRALAPSGGCDCAIEVGGTQLTLDVASGVVAERGRLVIAGYHQDGPRTVDMQSWNWRGLDVINAHERDPRIYVAGMRAAVDAVVRGGWDPQPLFTHRLELGELHRALDLVESRPDGFLKALVLT